MRSLGPLGQPIVQLVMIILLATVLYVAVNVHNEHTCQARGSVTSYRWGMPGRCEVDLPRLP